MEKYLLVLTGLTFAIELGILVVVVMLLRYVNRVRLTSDESNNAAIACIAGDMNRLTRTVGIMVGAANPDAEKADALEKEGAIGALSKGEKDILAAQRKADLWRHAKGQRKG